ncbi:uncharacterized protein I206_106683 [Kwoniella pini CBS 10737]|uniref:Uncharacterized protein n=1 Tax=Kwoniella pini CBS 10737 TaxID=1296096 RepID=A0A1B9HTH7_9TREE|nr:uncharacterized protein I206_07428 [Kwoniella pini CBS 10737]OCF46575.1 hypothetical protein I206_07428 [Kwoniella pini CBS 10737]
MREDARKTKPEMKEKQEMMESGYQPYSNTFSSVQSSDRSVRVPDWRTFLPEAKKIFEIQKYDYLAVNEGEIGQLLSQASYLTNSFKSPYIGSHNDSNSISSTERGNLTNAQYQAPHLEPSFSGANLTNDPRCQGQENSLFGQNQAVYSNQASFPNQAFDPDQAFYSSQAFNPDTADTPMVNVHNFRQHVPAQRYDMPNAPGTVNYAIGDLTGLTDKEFKDLVDAQTSQQNH